jgi:hypothetical protein
MPLYRYHAPESVIDELRFITNGSGGTRAYLHAGESATPEQLRTISETLASSGYVTVPCRIKDRDMLEIRGFKKEEDIRIVLGEVGAVHGESIRDRLAEDTLSIKDWFKQKSLMLTSLAYLVGDLCYVQFDKLNAGIKHQKKQQKAEAINEALLASSGGENAKRYDSEIPVFHHAVMKSPLWDTLSGYGYLAGTTTSLVSLALRGDSSDRELGDIARRVSRLVNQEGLSAEGCNALQHATTFKDTRSPFAQKFTTYSSEMLNGSFAVAGLAIAKQNIETYKRLHAEEQHYGHVYDFSNDTQHQNEKSVAKKDLLLGLGTITSGIASAVINEKPHDSNKPHKQGLAGIWEHLKEKPLRIAGLGYFMSTAIHIAGSLQERRSLMEQNKSKADKDKIPITHTTYRLIFGLLNVVAEGVMYFSSKGHGEGVRCDESLNLTAAALVAQIIAKQPPERHAEMVEKMATSLAKPEMLGMKIEKAKELLTSQLQGLASNQWANAMGEQDCAVPVTIVTDAKQKAIETVAPPTRANKPVISPTRIQPKKQEDWQKTLTQPANTLSVVSPLR